MTKTPIQWTDFSVNPFKFRNLETGKIGHHCTKISPGCALCYASRLNGGPYLSGLTYIESNKSKGEFFLDETVLQKVLRRKKPARIFWCDMTDMFLEDYPDEWIDRCFAVMALTPWHTHQVLTKRAKRMREYFADLAYRTEMIGIRAEYLSGLDRYQWTEPVEDSKPTWPLPVPNVWLGVSVEDQQHADERIPHLLAIPATVRFVSYEPALGPVDFSRWFGSSFDREWAEWNMAHYGYAKPLSWIIAGGESGPGARPCNVAWLRNVVEQCKAANVPCFVKQLGSLSVESIAGDQWPLELDDPKGGDPDEWPGDLRVRQMPA